MKKLAENKLFKFFCYFPRKYDLMWYLRLTIMSKKIPNITALSNISFATILTNIFAKYKTFLFSCFVNLDNKKLQYCITEGENVQEPKLSKLSTFEGTVSDSYL